LDGRGCDRFDMIGTIYVKEYGNGKE
jgi:hypothetical protein